MRVEFKTIKEFGKWAVEIVDDGDGRFSIVKYEDKHSTDIINITKEDVESMMAFINRNKEENK
tara:strand:+ start:1338 stop:1526 length:189 start_codon:yes stop_codon:yes gene_type:complete